MPKKRHLADDLREAVARSEGLDAAALIAEAREAALAEVRAELARLFADELRERALKALAPQSAVPAGRSTSLVGVVEAGAVPADAEAISIASLRALVVEIEAAELDDPQRLEQRVRAHNELLLAAGELGPVVPIRFGTFFASTVDVAGWLERNEHSLLEELDRLRDASEWALAITTAAPAPVPAASGAGSYLERRLAEGEAEAERRRTLAERAGAWHDRLAGVAGEARAAARADRALDAAYLVRQSGEAAFHTAVEEVRAEAEAEGLEARLTGPWPPFSFVREELR